MTDLSLVLVTAPDDDVAARLARGMVDGGLAACVNLLPGVRSFYVWKGKVEEEIEVQLLIKTRSERFEELAAWVREHHPYEVPEIISVPIEDGSASYLEWVREQTNGQAVS